MNRLQRTMTMLASSVCLLSTVGCHIANDWTAAMHGGCGGCGRGGHGHGGMLAHHTRVRPDISDRPGPGQFLPVPTRPVFFPDAVTGGPEFMSPPLPESIPPQVTPPEATEAEPEVSSTPPRSIKRRLSVVAKRSEPTPADPFESTDDAPRLTRQATWVASSAAETKPATQTSITTSPQTPTTASNDGWRPQRERR